MALPLLGVAARFLASKGVREAVKKYGTKAVDEAKKQIAKRQAAIDKGAKKTNYEKGFNTKKPSRAARELQQAKKTESGRAARTTSKRKESVGFDVGKQGAAANKASKLRKEKGIKSPVTGKTRNLMAGGKVRGIGKAMKGVRACKMR